jgi:hypothetical protein
MGDSSTGGSVTGGSVTGGSVTGGSVTGGSVTGGCSTALDPVTTTSGTVGSTINADACDSFGVLTIGLSMTAVAILLFRFPIFYRISGISLDQLVTMGILLP